jgi:DNA-binding NarL/FixJ family response regulator
VIGVLIADDEALVRGGFRAMLATQPDIEVVGEAADGEEAVERARSLRPAVVLMDIRMPRLDGLEATRRLLGDGGSRSRVLVLTTFDRDLYVYEALKAGASGFLLKDTPPERLVEAVRVVAAGEALLAPAITRKLIEEHLRGPAPGQETPAQFATLTQRESEVLRLLAQGASNAEIAEQLIVSRATVKSHVAAILGKLGLRDRIQAVVLCYETGFVRPGEHQSPPTPS